MRNYDILSYWEEYVIDFDKIIAETPENFCSELIKKLGAEAHFRGVIYYRNTPEWKEMRSVLLTFPAIVHGRERWGKIELSLEDDSSNRIFISDRTQGKNWVGICDRDAYLNNFRYMREMYLKEKYGDDYNPQTNLVKRKDFLTGKTYYMVPR